MKDMIDLTPEENKKFNESIRDMMQPLTPAICVILTSKISNRTVRENFTAKQILDFCGEECLVEAMTECNCTQLHEYGYDPCDCSDEWEDYDMEMKVSLYE